MSRLDPHRLQFNPRAILIFVAVILIIAALALSGCDDGDRISNDGPKPGQSIDWQAGPIIDGKNAGSDIRVSPDGSFAIPERGPGAKYITFRGGRLSGKSRITMRYRVDLPEGVQIVPTSNPEQQSIITLYFQRAGDNWSGRGEYETYRWYATSASQMPIIAGEHEITVSLDPGTSERPTWTSIIAANSYANSNFDNAKAKADRVGFVLGGGTGYGHGVYATGEGARFTILDYRIE